jgi:hypothetical protein
MTKKRCVDEEKADDTACGDADDSEGGDVEDVEDVEDAGDLKPGNAEADDTVVILL